MKENKEINPRLGKVGGQAVLEGVMMKSGERWCLAVRDEDGGIKKRYGEHVSLRKKYKFCNLPIVRGVINMVEMMMLSMKTLTASAEMLGIDEAESESKVDKWLTEKLGDKLMSVIMGIATVLGVVLSVGLFILLPTFVAGVASDLTNGFLGTFRALIEGVLKIGIFILYIFLVSLMPDIRRTFEYHGAEHKSVACYEAGLELTPENASRCTRFHPRCGTSFIFVMLILSVVISAFIGIENTILRSAVKLLLLPLSVGLGFEFIMYAGKHANILTKILSAPGLWMQRLTTKEPDNSQLEVAIRALKSAMPEEFPEERENEESDENEVASDGDNTNSDKELSSSKDDETKSDESGESVSAGISDKDDKEAAEIKAQDESETDNM